MTTDKRLKVLQAAYHDELMDKIDHLKAVNEVLRRALQGMVASTEQADAALRLRPER